MIDQRLLDAYLDYSGDLARRGILSHALDVKILDGKTLEQSMREELAEAGIEVPE